MLIFVLLDLVLIFILLLTELWILVLGMIITLQGDPGQFRAPLRKMSEIIGQTRDPQARKRTVGFMMKGTLQWTDQGVQGYIVAVGRGLHDHMFRRMAVSSRVAFLWLPGFVLELCA
ncbi:hypothetical protein M5689_005610 [Euphorbia peplus]|nr:hypothetical protein M5689_005610 [Euphorbia peplus]